MNKVILIGNIGNEVELKSTQKIAVVNFNLATTEQIKDEKRTEWHRVVCFGKLAELTAKYLSKGSKCMIEGKIQTRKWTDKAGKENYTTEILASNLEFLDAKKSNQTKSDDIFS